MNNYYAQCEECTYESESMQFKDVVFKVCMDGGFVKSDKANGYESECPNCESGNLGVYPS